MYFIKVGDGTKIVVEDLNRTSNKVIVMVHGWPLNRKMWEYQQNMLLDLGYRVVSYDIRGFGESDASCDNYSYDQLATDLWCVIDNLKVNSVTLMGFSMGGAICAHYMAMFENEKVNKLILVGAAAPSFVKNSRNPFGSTTENMDTLIMQTYCDRPKMVSDFQDKVFALQHSSPYKIWFRNLCFSASGIGTIKTAISLRNEDIYDDLEKIKVPTVILHGKLDQICPFGFAEIMEKEIPNATLVPFEFSGHGIFYDELEKFNQVLLQFLEK